MRKSVEQLGGASEDESTPNRETDGSTVIRGRVSQAIRVLLRQDNENQVSITGSEPDRSPWFLPTSPRLHLALGIAFAVLLFLGSQPV